MSAITAEAPLAPGDVVQLKSGGPAMTLDEVLADKSARCAWFVGEEYRLASFPVAALRRAAPTTMSQAAPPSAEPDVWETCTTLPCDQWAPPDEIPPPMHAVLGAWYPFAAAATKAAGDVIFWRRPLRKVAP
jgi:uncharacterized protein YodC (DUF2158 family)